ncbi:MAG: tRNA uridine-5-carboxymethylaminomethyl(34) synthesis GTPase MnmE [Gemmatimonadota bacterium]
MLSDPIAAVATPAGRSALAIVRLSGNGAFDVAARVIPAFTSAPPRTAHLATFHTARHETIDRGLYTVFPAPGSYTGEDLVELTCHGGFVVPLRLVTALYAAGARAAAPGEFTRRAVLNGKMDLLQAEAVGDLIDATAPAQARLAIHQLDGALSRRIETLRSGIIEIEALLGYSIDFPEEDDGPIPVERVLGAIDQSRATIDRLIRTAPAGQRLREGALVVIAGRPNAGKSSLFNALVGTDRVLVSAVPGTTRDAVEAYTDFEGWPIRLMDTAGLGEFESEVDRLGVDVSRRYIEAADVLLLCVDAGHEADDVERELTDARTIRLRTRSDLNRPTSPGIPVSVVSGEGLDQVRQLVAARAFAEPLAALDLEPALTRERHRESLLRSATALNEARERITLDADPVLASHHVRDAAHSLDELIGTVDIEMVLDRLFASFCIGK